MKYLYIVFFTVLFSCNDSGSFLNNTYSVSEVIELSPRKLEEKNIFSVKGIVSSKLNFGFVNAYSLQDEKYSKYQILVSSDYKSSPAKDGEMAVIKLKLLKEISFNSITYYLFQEVRN